MKLRSYWLLVLFLLIAAPVVAQNRPGKFSTITTTDTSADSLHVGCSIGSSTCTGGIKAGALVIGGGTSIASSSNIALLATANAFTASQTISVTNVASTALSVRYNASNPLMGITIANSNAFPYLGFNTKAQAGSDTPVYDITGFAAQFRMDNGAFKFLTAPSGSAAGAITLTERWGINNAGDLTVGASTHIADSNGTPAITSGFGTSPTIAGTDYGFVITIGTGASTGGLVTFGHTFSSAPICVGSTTSINLDNMTMLSSTTTLTIAYDSGSLSGVGVYVLCRGY